MNAIICAAIRSKDGRIVKGHRHSCPAMQHFMEIKGWDWADFREQGFMDMFGKFVTREEAYIIHKDNGQFEADIDRGGKLYSENLY